MEHHFIRIKKIYILNGDLFADRKELIRYIYESSIEYILGGNNKKHIIKRRELMEKVIYLAGHILNEAMVDYRENNITKLKQLRE